MNENLTLWSTTKEIGSAVKEVSNAVGTMINTYNTMRTVRKEESIILKEKIRAFQVMARTRGMGEISRANIEEIAKTQKFIDQCNLDGKSLEYAMQLLEQLNYMIIKNLEVYTNEF